MEQKFKDRDRVFWKGYKGLVIGYNEKFPGLVQVLFPFGVRQIRESEVTPAEATTEKKEM